jgi:hypothetical protein
MFSIIIYTSSFLKDYFNVRILLKFYIFVIKKRCFVLIWIFLFVLERPLCLLLLSFWSSLYPKALVLGIIGKKKLPCFFSP